MTTTTSPERENSFMTPTERTLFVNQYLSRKSNPSLYDTIVSQLGTAPDYVSKNVTESVDISPSYLCQMAREAVVDMYQLLSRDNHFEEDAEKFLHDLKESGAFETPDEVMKAVKQSLVNVFSHYSPSPPSKFFLFFYKPEMRRWNFVQLYQLCVVLRNRTTEEVGKVTSRWNKLNEFVLLAEGWAWKHPVEAKVEGFNFFQLGERLVESMHCKKSKTKFQKVRTLLKTQLDTLIRKSPKNQVHVAEMHGMDQQEADLGLNWDISVEQEEKEEGNVATLPSPSVGTPKRKRNSRTSKVLGSGVSQLLSQKKLDNRKSTEKRETGLSVCVVDIDELNHSADGAPCDEVDSKDSTHDSASSDEHHQWDEHLLLDENREMEINPHLLRTELPDYCIQDAPFFDKSNARMSKKAVKSFKRFDPNINLSPDLQLSHNDSKVGTDTYKGNAVVELSDGTHCQVQVSTPVYPRNPQAKRFSTNTVLALAMKDPSTMYTPRRGNNHSKYDQDQRLALKSDDYKGAFEKALEEGLIRVAGTDRYMLNLERLTLCRVSKPVQRKGVMKCQHRISNQEAEIISDIIPEVNAMVWKWFEDQEENGKYVKFCRTVRAIPESEAQLQYLKDNLKLVQGSGSECFICKNSSGKKRDPATYKRAKRKDSTRGKAAAHRHRKKLTVAKILAGPSLKCQNPLGCPKHIVLSKENYFCLTIDHVRQDGGEHRKKDPCVNDMWQHLHEIYETARWNIEDGEEALLEYAREHQLRVLCNSCHHSSEMTKRQWKAASRRGKMNRGMTKWHDIYSTTQSTDDYLDNVSTDEEDEDTFDDVETYEDYLDALSSDDEFTKDD